MTDVAPTNQVTHPEPPVRDASNFKDMLLNIRDDVRQYAPGSRSFLVLFVEGITNQGVWATVIYRYGHWVNFRPRWQRIPLRVVYVICKKIIEMVTSIHIESTAKIGPGLVIDHFGPVLLGGDMGAYCNVSPGVVVGLGEAHGMEGHPKIGHRVYIAPGAKLFGPIKVGNDAIIGPNSVVHRDVPDNAVVLGVPARVIGWQIGKEPSAAGGESPAPQAADGAKAEKAPQLQEQK